MKKINILLLHIVIQSSIAGALELPSNTSINTIDKNTIATGQAMSAPLTNTFYGIIGDLFEQTLNINDTAMSVKLIEGALPGGLHRYYKTITGVPIKSGIFSFRLQITDVSNVSYEMDCSIQIFKQLIITTNSLDDGCVGEPYSVTLSAEGGTEEYSFTVSELPDGLKLVGNQIRGTPRETFLKNVYINVRDSLNNMGNEPAILFLRIRKALTVLSFPDGLVESSYSHHLSISGGIYPYSCVMNGHIEGLTFYADEECLLEGIPTKAGNYPLDITITDSSVPRPQIRLVDMNVNIHQSMYIDQNSILPVAIENTAIEPIKLTVIGAKGALHGKISSDSLPPNIHLDQEKMILSGTPSSAGQYIFEIFVTDGTQETRKMFIWYIRKKLIIKPQILPEMAFQQPYGPYVFNISNGVKPVQCAINTTLPAGIIFDAQSCRLSGVMETYQDDFSIFLTVFDSGQPPQYATKNFPIETHNPEILSISPNTLLPVMAYGDFLQIFTSRNSGADLNWEVISGSIPGLYFEKDFQTLKLSGIPLQPGHFPFTLELSDRQNKLVSDRVDYTLTVIAPLSIETQLLDYVIKDRIYSDVISVNNGEGPYDFWIESGELVSGIQLNTETGELYGMLTQDDADSKNVHICVEESGVFHQKTCRSFPMLIRPDANFDILMTQEGIAQQFSPLTLTFKGTGGFRPYKWILPDILPEGMLFKYNDEGDLLLFGQPAICNPESEIMFRPRLIDLDECIISHAYGVDIACACHYKISGNISHLPKIVVSLYKENDILICQTVTDALGNYTFTNIGCESYTIKPTSEQFLFIPDQISYVGRQDKPNMDFNAQFVHEIPKERYKTKALVLIGDEAFSLTNIHNEIINALEKKGFQPERQYQWIDQQSNSPVEQIETAINNWASDTSLLWLYIGGVRDNSLIINAQEITVQKLSEWLNQYTQPFGKQIVLIAEGVSAREFVVDLDIFNIIKIAAPWPKKTEEFCLYFSSTFWYNLSRDSLSESYTRAIKERFNMDDVILDANCDKIENSEDFIIADTITLNTQCVIPPKIVAHVPDQSLHSKDNVNLWAQVEPGTYSIDTVYAKLYSLPLPESYPFDPTDITPSRKLEYNEMSMCYETNLRLTKENNYYIVFWAMDKYGNYANPKISHIDRGEIYKAIIVSGKRAAGETDFLQDAVLLNAAFAYDTLEQAGFLSEDIVYLSAYDNFGFAHRPFQQLDSANGLKEAILQTANVADRMLIYMIDHGDEDNFYISGDDNYVSSKTFTEWMESIADDLPKGLLLIYDACHSGDFLSKVHTNKIKPFLRMTATSPGEKAVFHNDGTLSFSFLFWTNICTGSFSIAEAFDNAKNFLTQFSIIEQTPRMDLNGNNEWNENYENQQGFYILQNQPIPVNIETLAITDTPKNRAVLDISCELLDSVTNQISEVFAVVHPPNPITKTMHSLQITMNQTDTNLFRATYPNALNAGDYLVHYYAKYKNGRQKLFSTKTVTQDSTLKKDCFEPDDHPALSISLDHWLHRNFHTETDTDYMYFYAQPNQTYTISVINAPAMSFAITGSHLNESVEWITKSGDTKKVWVSDKAGLYYLTTQLAATETNVINSYLINIFCSNNMDIYENDNNYTHARPIDVNSGSAQFHTFQNDEDEDWIKFFGVKGKNYTIQVSPDYSHQILSIEIFDENLNSLPLRTTKRYKQGRPLNCHKNGIYYVKLSPAQWPSQTKFGYQLRVFIATASPRGGNIKGRILDMGYQMPLPDVGVYIPNEDDPDLTTIDGWYRVSCYESGDVKVHIQKRGYFPQVIPVTCPPQFETYQYDFFMHDSLSPVVELLKLQAGMEDINEQILKSYMQPPYNMKHVLNFLQNAVK